MNSEFEQMLRTMKPEKMRMVSVANAIDVHVLRSLSTAHKMGFVNAILCGDTATIKSVANDNDIDISNFEIVHCDDELSAATMAVSLVRNGRADIVMKGLIHTADILRAVLNRENGIRGDGILSHVSVLYSPSLNRRLFLTDIAMVMYPDLEKKIQLIIQLENWQQGKEYDRVGDEMSSTSYFGIKIPKLTIPVSPGRNLAIIIEVAARNFRLKSMGYDASEELITRSIGR